MLRKDFIRNASLAAASVAFVPTKDLFAAKADVKVKMGLIGVGARGLGHLDLLLRREDVEVVCICRMLSSGFGFLVWVQDSFRDWVRYRLQVQFR